MTLRSGSQSDHSRSQKEDGSVLVLVLLVISILLVTVMESIRLARVEAMSAKVYSASLQCRLVAASGVAFAKYLLAKDWEEKDESDHPGEAWAGFPEQKDIPLPPLEVGGFNATITDEQGKFPINFLIDANGRYRPDYRRVFSRILLAPPFELAPEKIEELLQSIQDWIDTDSLPAGEYGAENEYYLSRDRDYTCRNSPLAGLGELLYIRGMTSEIFFGGTTGPGLKDLVTVHSTGKININTAPAIILAALVNPSVTQETAREFARNAVAYRLDPKHFDFLKELDWYRNRMSGYNDIQIPAGLLSTRSRYFSVRVRAMSGSVSLTRIALLQRETAKGKTTFRTLITETQ